MNATVWLDARQTIGPIDARIFSGSLEHLGRAVYDGEVPALDVSTYRRATMRGRATRACFSSIAARTPI